MIAIHFDYIFDDEQDLFLREWEKNIVFREIEHLSEKEKLFASARSSGVLVQIEGKEPPGKAAEMMYAAMQV